MSRPRWDGQFAETVSERNARLRSKRLMRENKMSDDIINKMTWAFTRSLHQKNDDALAMRAALAVLADNVTDEMADSAFKAKSCGCFTRDIIAAAIREAGK
jgi:hypothetical protein